MLCTTRVHACTLPSHWKNFKLLSVLIWKVKVKAKQIHQLSVRGVFARYVTISACSSLTPGSIPIRRGNKERAVSHLPILPPLWAAIPSDTPIYPRPHPVRSQVPLFSLGATSSCPCPSTTRSFYSPARPVTIREGTLYTTTEAFPCSTELQPCPNCPKSRNQFIGPDLREAGVFNFNNSIFVSHELLDEYTSAYTSSETPFDSWAEFLNRRYLLSGSTFMGKDLFRSCWFAYVRLQMLEGDFCCPRCDKNPTTVIWDGVTLAFHRRHLLSTIQPPTTISSSSPVRPTRYIPGQHALPNPPLRKLLRSLLKKDHKNPDSSTVSDPESFSSVASQLHRINADLGEMFKEYTLPLVQGSSSSIALPLQNFFLQVSPFLYQAILHSPDFTLNR